MRRKVGRHPSFRALCLALVVLGLLASVRTATVNAQVPLFIQDFAQVAPEGFGDFHNSMARASEWWQGSLYVATSRDHACVQQAIIKQYLPLKPYPPPDPSLTCAPDPHDLPLQAEIWRWTPDGGAGVWERVYQSPNTVPIPGTTKFTAREIGFRDMAPFTEPDGTEALYITGIAARGYIPGAALPTLLRTTDGVNWAPVPQDPGTTLGDLNEITDITCPPSVPNCKITVSAFNKITAFNGHLFMVVGGDFGHGVIYEATDPAGGNNNFRRVSPPGKTYTYHVSVQGLPVLRRGHAAGGRQPPVQRGQVGGHEYRPVHLHDRGPGDAAAGVENAEGAEVGRDDARGGRRVVGSDEPAGRAHPDQSERHLGPLHR